MKFSFIILLFFLSMITSAQPLTYEMWNEEAKTNIRLTPEYGNATKTEAQKKADEEFIKTTLQQDGTKEKASQHLVELGFKYLYKGDLKTAMYRFNQAWLLNSQNEDAYWGFGAIYLTFGDFDNALKQYDAGLILNPKSSNIITDKATLYLALFNSGGADNTNLLTAIGLFGQSYQINPKNQNTLFKLSAAHFLNKDCTSALKYYQECKALGGAPISKEYEEELLKSCK